MFILDKALPFIALLCRLKHFNISRTSPYPNLLFKNIVFQAHRGEVPVSHGRSNLPVLRIACHVQTCCFCGKFLIGDNKPCPIPLFNEIAEKLCVRSGANIDNINLTRERSWVFVSFEQYGLYLVLPFDFNRNFIPEKLHFLIFECPVLDDLLCP